MARQQRLVVYSSRLRWARECIMSKGLVSINSAGEAMQPTITNTVNGLRGLRGSETEVVIVTDGIENIREIEQACKLQNLRCTVVTYW